MNRLGGSQRRALGPLSHHRVSKTADLEERQDRLICSAGRRGIVSVSNREEHNRRAQYS